MKNKHKFGLALYAVIVFFIVWRTSDYILPGGKIFNYLDTGEIGAVFLIPFILVVAECFILLMIILIFDHITFKFWDKIPK